MYVGARILPPWWVSLSDLALASFQCAWLPVRSDFSRFKIMQISASALRLVFGTMVGHISIWSALVYDHSREDYARFTNLVLVHKLLSRSIACFVILWFYVFQRGERLDVQDWHSFETSGTFLL